MNRNYDYTTGNLLDFAYFKENYRLIAIDLSKQTKLKDLQQISFIGKLESQNNGAKIFFIIEKSEETTLEFLQNFVNIVNLLNSSENKYPKFASKKWYVIDSESKVVYSYENSIKFLKSLLESSLCDYSEAYVLVAGNIAVVGANNNTKVVFKNCALFIKCRTEINETFIDEAGHINIAMPMYNLTEYSDNYSDTLESLWQFKRDEIERYFALTVDGNRIPNNSLSFKYKSSLITNRNGVKNSSTTKLFKYFLEIVRNVVD